MSHQLNHDPFARYSLHRERVPATFTTCCIECGRVNKRKEGNYLYRYWTVNDDSLRGEKHYIKGLFCSAQCKQQYGE